MNKYGIRRPERCATRFAAALIALTGILFAGCTRNPLIDPKVPNVGTAADTSSLFQPTVEKDYHFQIGDHIRVESYYDPQLNQSVVVRPDGRISLLFMDEVFVLDMTPAALDQLVTQAYKQHLELPEITVVVDQINNQHIYIGGEVRSEAMQPITGPLTVTQAITAAGGLTPSANPRQVLLLRKQDASHFVTYQLDAEQLLLSSAPQVYLRAADVVYVPRTRIAEIGKFVDQYINAIVPRAVSNAFGYSIVANHIDNGGNSSVITVAPSTR